MTCTGLLVMLFCKTSNRKSCLVSPAPTWEMTGDDVNIVVFLFRWNSAAVSVCCPPCCVWWSPSPRPSSIWTGRGGGRQMVPGLACSSLVPYTDNRKQTVLQIQWKWLVQSVSQYSVLFLKPPGRCRGCCATLSNQEDIKSLAVVSLAWPSLAWLSDWECYLWFISAWKIEITLLFAGLRGDTNAMLDFYHQAENGDCNAKSMSNGLQYTSVICLDCRPSESASTRHPPRHAPASLGWWTTAP